MAWTTVNDSEMRTSTTIIIPCRVRRWSGDDDALVVVVVVAVFVVVIRRCGGGILGMTRCDGDGCCGILLPIVVSESSSFPSMIGACCVILVIRH